MDATTFDSDKTARPSLALTRANFDLGVTPQDTPSAQLTKVAAESLAAQARWEGPVRAAGGEKLVDEPIWPHVANALEHAAMAGFDLTDDLPNLVNGQWVATLRLMDDADLNPTGIAMESAPATAHEVVSAVVSAKTLAMTRTKAQSASVRSR